MAFCGCFFTSTQRHVTVLGGNTQAKTPTLLTHKEN